jgi:hypothetical protein
MGTSVPPPQQIVYMYCGLAHIAHEVKGHAAELMCCAAAYRITTEIGDPAH